MIFGTKMNFWIPNLIFESLPRHRSIEIRAVSSQHGDPKNEKTRTYVRIFLCPGGPFEVTYRQISVPAVQNIFSQFAAVPIASQTTSFVLTNFSNFCVFTVFAISLIFYFFHHFSIFGNYFTHFGCFVLISTFEINISINIFLSLDNSAR